MLNIKESNLLPGSIDSKDDPLMEKDNKIEQSDIFEFPSDNQIGEYKS